MERFGSNSGYVDDLYQQFLQDPSSVSAAWQEFFRRDTEAGHPPRDAGSARRTQTAVLEPLPELPEPITPEFEAEEEEGDASVAPIRGVAARIVENMETSLGVPTATTVRTIPVRLLEENRRLINEHQQACARAKVSFTHLIGYALRTALEEHPALNDGYQEVDGKPFKITRTVTNLGLAIDVERRGERSLVVPNIKDVASFSFSGFLSAFDDLVARARSGKTTVEDFADTTITLTNPGVLGTSMSVPRLMAGQGAIVGTGAIAYPPQCAGMSPDAIAKLGFSKVMTLTSTYDHRVIQGAQSGVFLATVEDLLLGKSGFYSEIFEDLGVPHEPFIWAQEEGGDLSSEGEGGSNTFKQAQVLQLIEGFRTRGHLMAHLDPLGTGGEPHPELELRNFGLSVWDLERSFLAGGVAGSRQRIKLRTLLDILRQTYCQYIGVEFMHISSIEERIWLQERMEATRNEAPISIEEKLHILHKLNEAEAFERFLHSSYVGQKRFSLEGCECLIPALDGLISAASSHGVKEVVIGMAHRGRLNVLVSILGKSLEQVFHEFEDVDPESTEGSGDVKYHLGSEGVHRFSKGEEVRLILACNPSHLEAVNPVVEGMVRARQDRDGENHKEEILPLLIHGDAALAGQGVVFETLNMSKLEGYSTGGTVHMVINNQIGFTTMPRDARSSRYCTDVAKSIEAPVFHVNADHPQSAVRMVRLALEYRQRFGKDVFIDLVCYRRWGHNEGDEPAFTQPLVYERIKHHRSVRKLATERLIARGEIDMETAEKMLEEFQELLAEAFEKAKTDAADRLEANPRPDHEEREGTAGPTVETAVDASRIDNLLSQVVAVPDSFNLHPKLARQFEKRLESARDGRVDWGLGELLAFGSLLEEGVSVRLSGEDSARGTFSHRHAVVVDSVDGNRHSPLETVAGHGASFNVHDSLLSEFAVLGFEYGYSVARPEDLTVWEAQFGDFSNGAQIVIDQFISSAEEKWGQVSPLVMLLPHGFEGQGPEHSSARLERFLQLCAEGNIVVAQPSTPAQCFHLLRRQVVSNMRKPLVVLSPKSLLRLPGATSTLDQFTSGGFKEVIADGLGAKTRRLLISSGRVHYDLAEERDRGGHEGVGLLRFEQFYPFPHAELARSLSSLGEDCEIFWVQDEPKNMGAWSFLRNRFSPTLGGGRRVTFVGRPWSASPASGSKGVHEAERRKLIGEAFDGL
ncbi:MAG TPA: multifunctional oxoglutarate decarboxylase/oxoglutarate dehydrogenase thiamine pyrophosphate-binding subunit/dihydrolipoyllysine-residue succinyltransferase subunit [Planctomycetes bacterium]|nr:multifunctional oxoglutarate decarboxylase/oxoglutarate dehydrogenase thiamine pyrophosphate-binding subunit/dihydrolipoyllysine-residue succinyltransferase subunit [Planctomycetota bacterium]